jgi:hypothetical protein
VRLAKVESDAVHKGAVQDLINVVKQQQEEINKIKFGLGLDKVMKPEEVLANLNGEPIPGGQ